MYPLAATVASVSPNPPPFPAQVITIYEVTEENGTLYVEPDYSFRCVCVCVCGGGGGGH
jgi:hypothetical protein